jgi:signal transduction histidine kinase
MRPGFRPPLVLRLFAAPEAGTQTNLARALVFGGAASGAALVLLAIGAARGIVHGERLERLEAERQRLDALALAGAGLAHRLRNPLAAIKGTAQLVADEPGAPAEARARRIVEASERIDALLVQLLKFARPPEPQVEPFDLSAVAREVAARATPPVRVEAAHEVRAAGDRGHAAEILDELVANARAHDPDGEIFVAVRSERDAAVAEVLDRGSGLGVDPGRAFDPYVTTRPGGTGLGLPTVRALARASGGDVMLSRRAGGGCAARLALRRAEKS